MKFICSIRCTELNDKFKLKKISDKMSLNVGVIGAGSMGTAISQIIARNANKIYL